jgi:signal transduction histidine kinase
MPVGQKTGATPRRLDPPVRRGRCYLACAIGVALPPNAIEASVPKGGRLLTVKLHATADVAVLEVTDQGTGIEPDVMSRIFDPLFTTKPFDEATGLGLTVVHDMVVRGLGGTVEVDSHVGEGTTFTLRFVRPKMTDDGIEQR